MVERIKMAGEQQEGGPPQTSQEGVAVAEKPVTLVAPSNQRKWGLGNWFGRGPAKVAPEVSEKTPVPSVATKAQVIANAALSDEQRLQAAEKLLGSLSDIQKTTLKRMHEVGLNKPGKDKRYPAGVYNYTQRQITEKTRIGAEKTETGEEIFNKKQRRTLFEAGLVGILPPSEITIDPNSFPVDSPLRAVAEEIQDIGTDRKADEDYFKGIADRIQGLIDTGKTTYADAKDLIRAVKGWQQAAKEAPASGGSDFEQAKIVYDWYQSKEKERALTPAEDAERNARKTEMDTLVDEAETIGVLGYFYQDVRNLYQEITSEPVSGYGEGESRRTTDDRIETARRALTDYQETFWEFGDPTLSGLQQRYKGVAAYIASRVGIAIEKSLKGIALSPTEIGDKEISGIKSEAEERKKREMERNPFWDRSWGRIMLTGRTKEEVIRGVDNFLQITTAEDSNFEANRNMQDADGLNQEIQRRGQQVGMNRKEILEQVARAEGTLLISVADHFAVRWNVPEWHQVASLIGRHIDTRLNAVSKAYDAEVMHAAYILDNDEEYDKYSRQAGFASDLSADNDEAAASEKAEIRRRLEVRIALSQLKGIDTVIREHFAGIETQIDSFGFDRSAQIPATELFKNPQYLAEIKKIDDKLKALNQKYALGFPVVAADKLTDQEKQLLALDRISKCKKTEDLVVIDQTDAQFKNLYIEYGGFGTKAGYDAEIQRLQLIMPGLQQKIINNEQLTDDEMKQIRFWQRDQLLKRMESNDNLTDEEIRSFPEIFKAKQAVDLAVKTRNVFFISTEKACVSLITRHNTTEGQGELLSYNDVVRLNKFVRERAIASLPPAVAQAITSSTGNGAGLMYVDIADKLEFINLSQKVLTEKGEKDVFGQNAKEALRLITLTEEEKSYSNHVQAVEDIQEGVLKKLKEKGSSLTVSDIDTIILGKISGAILSDTESVHKGEANVRKTVTYKDIVNREDADPQYNFSMMDDQKYSSLLLSDENKAAAYNPDHPYYYSIPATVRRVLDPDQSKLVHTGDPDVDRANTFKVQETQRRFHFAVDSVKVFGAFYDPDPYEEESKKPTVAEMVINIRNAPFIGRRMIEQRAWTLWNRGQAYRGRGFLKYLESNFRGLDHSVGRRGLRGVTASYNGFSAKGFDYAVDFSGALDELKAEFWLGQAKGADEIRPVLVGGQVGQDPNFEGILKKIVKVIGVNNPDYQSVKGGAEYASPPLWLIANGKWEDLEEGDYEKAIDAIEDRWKRVSIYGTSLGFVGNVSQVPLAAKFSADTASRRMVYWAVVHPEAESAYHMNMGLIRAILQPLSGKTVSRKLVDYFGKDATLFSEWQRRVFLPK